MWQQLRDQRRMIVRRIDGLRDSSCRVALYWLASGPVPELAMLAYAVTAAEGLDLALAAETRAGDEP